MVIKGIGGGTCVYVNPALDQFWLIDDRIYEPEGDRKTNLEHVEEMLTNALNHKHLLCESVLMETWDVTKHLMLAIEALHIGDYCPLKDHRQVDDSTGQSPDRRVDSLAWSPQEQRHGKIANIKGFPNAHQVKVFRVVLSFQRTDDVVTNNLAQDSTAAVEEKGGWRCGDFLRDFNMLVEEPVYFTFVCGG